MTTLMKNDPKLRVVLKEMPVLSQGSLEAAQVARRAHDAGQDPASAISTSTRSF